MYRDAAFQECPRVPYKDLPEWAGQAARHGVTALLLGDWKIGSDGDGIPRFEPDPAIALSSAGGQHFAGYVHDDVPGACQLATGAPPPAGPKVDLAVRADDRE